MIIVLYLTQCTACAHQSWQNELNTSIIMKLAEFGYNEKIQKLIKEFNLTESDVGRIISEHKERYIVATSEGKKEAEITGNIRYSAKGREDFPAVGDWVSLIKVDESKAIIHAVLPRYSMISRKSVSNSAEIQIIASNIDYALIMQATDRDFSLNRLERYLAISSSAEIRPVIILSKTDLVTTEKLQELSDLISKRIPGVPLIPLSNSTMTGYDQLKTYLIKGLSYCLLGSSGVGKSTLINNLSAKSHLKTESISGFSDRGKHTTTHREMIILDNGALLFDNPGMREVGMTEQDEGLKNVFEEITQLAENCRFDDCTHIHEKGCAVIEALEIGDLDRESYENFLRMERERSHFESTLAERRKKDKEFGKMVKTIKKNKI